MSIFDDPRVCAFFEACNRMHMEGEDEVLYEGNLVRMERKDGKILMTGKPFRCPIMYREDEPGV